MKTKNLLVLALISVLVLSGFQPVTVVSAARAPAESGAPANTSTLKLVNGEITIVNSVGTTHTIEFRGETKWYDFGRGKVLYFLIKVNGVMYTLTEGGMRKIDAGLVITPAMGLFGNKDHVLVQFESNWTKK